MPYYILGFAILRPRIETKKKAIDLIAFKM